jgi:hypothetical protein
MIIANPIYDIVFKYLMEDLDIAKGLLSLILDVEIEELTFKPQETASETEFGIIPIRIYRLDFAAVIKQSDGSLKKVLIELQKTKRNTNITRFRRYLAENYQKEDVISVNGKEIKQSLEIVTIYFLGFPLTDIDTSILQVGNYFKDINTGELLDYTPKNDFVRLLNHESYMIQIPKLIGEQQSKVEKVLNIFSQKYITNDEHTLNYRGNEEDPLVQQMLKRLTRAVADEQVRRNMDAEDEFDREYAELEEKYASIIEQQKQEIEELKRLLAKK